jgi:nitrite reductase/ring-hydroxylating ferredoxin subunit
MDRLLTTDPRPTFVDVQRERPLPGEVVVMEIDATPVAVATFAGTLVAFDETCTHRECPLSEGVIDDSSVTCPCHKSRFDLRTGQPLNGPATQPIRVRAVRVQHGRLFIER